MSSADILGSSKIAAFVGVRDAQRACAFYGDTLGLRLVSEDAFALVFDANGTTLRVSLVREVVAAPYAVLGWEVDDIVAKGSGRLGAGHSEACGQFAFGADHLHASAAAACGCLDDDRKADFARKPACLGIGADAAVGAWNGRDAQVFDRTFGRDLIAHQADVLGSGTDEVNAVIGKYFGKTRILGEESVAWMHRIGAGDFAG